MRREFRSDKVFDRPEGDGVFEHDVSAELLYMGR